jgi:hypothetical protein
MKHECFVSCRNRTFDAWTVCRRGAQSADREGWAAHAVKPSLDAELRTRRLTSVFLISESVLVLSAPCRLGGPIPTAER